MREETIARVQAEIELLAEEIGGLGADGDRVKLGRVSVGGHDYIGVLIENLGVNPARFNNVKSVRALLLLPAEYPRMPALGVYVNQPFKVATRHFIKRAAHGAPDLVRQGWYWFCHGIGGFEDSGRKASWHAASNPADGDNLATIVAAARVRMNSAQ